MSITKSFTYFSLLMTLTLIASGCPSKPDYPGTGGGDAEDEKPAVFLEPFDAPTLEELDAKVEWEDRPVYDALERRRELEADTKPIVSVDEALKLKNTSTENNDKILSALGRVPQNDDEVDYDAELLRHFAADIKSTNPVLYSSVYESEIISVSGFGLFSFDEKMLPFALDEVVVSWQTSKDKLYDKVVMRDDLVWSDGTPLTAHDIEFTFKLIMNPEVPIPAVRTGMESVRWIQAYDDQTLVYFHKEPLATNVWNLNFPIIPKHIYEESVKEDPTLADSDYHQKYEKNPVCGGPISNRQATKRS